MLRHRAPKAYSLLEVVLASGVDARHLLLLYGVSKMEEHLAIVAAGWTEGTFTGSFAAEGHANVRFIVVQSDEVASGGIVDRVVGPGGGVFHAATAAGSAQRPSVHPSP